MILAGDEFARTQQGNNNAYAQDNEISWLDWGAIDADGEQLISLTRRLIALRQSQPMFRRGRFLTGAYNEELGIKDVSWLHPSGSEMVPEQWNDPDARCLGMLLDGRAQATGVRRKGSDKTVLLVLNAHPDTVRFKLPSVPGGKSWNLLLDTSLTDDSKRPSRFEFASEAQITGRSVVLWEAVASAPPAHRSRTASPRLGKRA